MNEAKVVDRFLVLQQLFVINQHAFESGADHRFCFFFYQNDSSNFRKKENQ